MEKARMIQPELQKAIDCLSIEDVYLRNFSTRCADDFEPKYADIESLTFQTRHFVKQSNVAELDGEGCLLRVFVDMGVRWIDESPEGETPEVKAYIEAEFVAEYTMSQKIEQAGIDAFSLQNASYHVWPYWRELLNSQCARMHLPRLMLPAVQLAQNRRVGDHHS
jgi:hypothetical protein